MGALGFAPNPPLQLRIHGPGENGVESGQEESIRREGVGICFEAWTSFHLRQERPSVYGLGGEKV